MACCLHILPPPRSIPADHDQHGWSRHVHYPNPERDTCASLKQEKKVSRYKYCTSRLRAKRLAVAYRSLCHCDYNTDLCSSRPENLKIWTCPSLMTILDDGRPNILVIKPGEYDACGAHCQREQDHGNVDSLGARHSNSSPVTDACTYTRVVTNAHVRRWKRVCCLLDSV